MFPSFCIIIYMYMYIFLADLYECVSRTELT